MLKFSDSISFHQIHAAPNRHIRQSASFQRPKTSISVRNSMKWRIRKGPSLLEDEKFKNIKAKGSALKNMLFGNPPSKERIKVLDMKRNSQKHEIWRKISVYIRNIDIQIIKGFKFIQYSKFY